MVIEASRRGLEPIYDFDDVPVALISSSIDVVDAVNRMMSRRSYSQHVADDAVIVSADESEDSWNILVDGKLVRALPHSNSAPFIAEELIATACAVAARRRQSVLIRGAVLEKDGSGLALIGEDIDSVQALGLHLHARQWTAITFGYSFLNRNTLEIVGLQSHAALSSASIDRIPPRYRRSIEASKWYNTGANLKFYAVDPYSVHPDHALSTTLSSILVIDGNIDEEATLESAFELTSLAFLEDHPMADSIRSARFTLRNPIASCDAIEHWFSAAT